MAKSSEFAAVGKDYNIIKRLGNTDHIISDETTKAANTPIAPAMDVASSHYRIRPPTTIPPTRDQSSSDAVSCALNHNEVSSRFVIFCTLLWTKRELCRFDQSATAGSGLSAS